MVTPAVSTAPIRAKATPASGRTEWPTPGRMTTITPMKPTATAAQRRGPTASFSTKKDRMVAKIGAVKLRVVASARGSSVSVWNRHRMAATPRALRPK